MCLNIKFSSSDFLCVTGILPTFCYWCN